MTEFLDRLIARSAGLNEVIRPRTPSLFEPDFQVSARVMPSAFGNTQFEEPGLSRAATPHAHRGETVQLNDREPVPIQDETAPNPFGQVTPVTAPGRLRSPAALPSVSSPVFLESRDVAAEIHPQPLEQPSAASMPRLAPDTNVEPRSVQIAFAEGQERKTKSGEVPVFFELREVAAGIRHQRLEQPDAQSVPLLNCAANVEPRSAQIAFEESSTHHQLATTPSATPPFLGKSIGVALTARGSASEVPLDHAVKRQGTAKVSHSISLPLDRNIFSPQSVVVRAHALAESTKPTEEPRAVRPIEQRWPPESRRPAEQQPTIRVTIGRIEVRAEQPSSLPPPKRRSNLKPMSLDEYLRQRTGRGRE